VLLFHRTTVAEARRIMKEGFVDETWNFGARARPGDDVPSVGVWLSDRALEPMIEGPEGDAVLEVSLELSEATLEPYRMEGLLGAAHLWILPAELVNRLATVRIGTVDPSSSGMFPRPGTPPAADA